MRLVRLFLTSFPLVAVLATFQICYDCHNGTPENPYAACPMDGNLDDVMLAAISCEGPCFARTNKYEPGVVYRGCTTHFSNVPATSPCGSCCEVINDDIWCLCYGDKCNTQNMTDLTLEEMTQTHQTLMNAICPKCYVFIHP